MGQDPGGVFPSNEHRKVLAHLPVPSADYGWTPSQLVERMRPDVDTHFVREDQMLLVLEDLRASGDAEEWVHGRSHQGWRQTVHGHNRLTGPIADEPPPAPASEEPPKRRRLFRKKR